VVVVPRPEHLHELRADGRILDVPADKAATLTESARKLFSPVSSTEVVFEIDYDMTLADSLVAMGPSAHHTSPLERKSALPGTLGPPDVHTTVTAAVDVLAFTPR
jgi:23S rRNA (guanine745-N1)-methyltransferase